MSGVDVLHKLMLDRSALLVSFIPDFVDIQTAASGSVLYERGRSGLDLSTPTIDWHSPGQPHPYQQSSLPGIALLASGPRPTAPRSRPTQSVKGALWRKRVAYWQRVNSASSAATYLIDPAHQLTCSVISRCLSSWRSMNVKLCHADLSNGTQSIVLID